MNAIDKTDGKASIFQKLTWDSGEKKYLQPNVVLELTGIGKLITVL